MGRVLQYSGSDGSCSVRQGASPLSVARQVVEHSAPFLASWLVVRPRPGPLTSGAWWRVPACACPLAAPALPTPDEPALPQPAPSGRPLASRRCAGLPSQVRGRAGNAHARKQQERLGSGNERRAMARTDRLTLRATDTWIDSGTGGR